MKAFRAFWNNALENGTTSAEDVWRGALEWALRQKIHHTATAIKIDKIEEELNDGQS